MDEVGERQNARERGRLAAYKVVKPREEFTEATGETVSCTVEEIEEGEVQ